MNVLVTGGSRGLGFEFVNVFVETGNAVATIVRSESAKRTVEKHYPKCTVLVADITNFSELDELDYLKNNSIDVLINNAGKASFGTSITDSEPDEIERQFKIHCLGAFNVTKAAYSALAKAEDPFTNNQIENGGYYCVETGTMQW
ncbi:MAG: SDR family oxidoreductase [Desulfobacteraceae bacterium]|jgi:short-subunit dehydrogenase